MSTTQQMFLDEADNAIIVDRSTLERYATCPRAGRAIESGAVKVGNAMTESGSEIHRIISEAVKVRKDEGMRTGDLAAFIEDMAAKCRPDLQPMVVPALRRAYPLAKLICETDGGNPRNPDDIICYDGGGEGSESGQVGGDIIPATDDSPAIRITGELDLLMATPSPEAVDLIDWKSGWTWWTATDAFESFQFQTYAWCLWQRFPSVKTINLRIFMPRFGQATDVAVFGHRDRYAIHNRMLSAARLYVEHREESKPINAPAWPMHGKCGGCEFAGHCADAMLLTKTDDPVQMLEKFAVVQEAADQMKTALTAIVRKTGKEITSGKLAFGTGKPKAARAPACDLYEL